MAPDLMHGDLVLKMSNDRGIGLRGWIAGQKSKSKDEDSKPHAITLEKNRVAVLPLTNLTPDPRDEYFADGMTEELISTLANISDLEVISRTSVMGYKGTTKRIKEIGKELEVGSIIEGSFRKAGNRIRITTQLIDAASDKHIWARSYEKELDDVFSVQTDIARQVAEALRVEILAPQMDRLGMKPTVSPKAHIAYLRGRFHWNRRGLEDIRKAQEYFQEAVKEDPSFALGYVGLADCYEIIATNWAIDRSENNNLANGFVAKALELNPDLAEAHASIGLILLNDFEFRGAEKEFKKAIELKPSYASAHQWYSHVLMAENKPDEAGREIQRALELDPFSGVINSNLGDYFYWRKDYAKALEIAKKAVELSPGGFYLHLQLAVRYGKLQMFDDAERERDLAIKLGRDQVPSVEVVADAALAYLRGDREMLRRLMPELESFFGGPLIPRAVVIAGYYFWLDEDDKGFDWLEQSCSRRESMLTTQKDEEVFDRVRADPRFINLLRGIGLEPARL